jgi:hypothetical protein
VLRIYRSEYTVSNIFRAVIYLCALFLLSTAGGAVEGDRDSIGFSLNIRKKLLESLIEFLIINRRYGESLEVANV